MIEENLCKRLQPIVNRRRRLYFAWRLSGYWYICGLVGITLLGANWFWGFREPIASWALCIASVLATALALYKSRRTQPDYKAVARNIERQHSDLQALLLAAIEQEPQSATGRDGQFGYLQERVIGDSLRHAANHDWLRSVPTKSLIFANLSGIAALSFLVIVLAANFQIRNSRFEILAGGRISVSPGDISVESGTPVVILARFDGRVPKEAKLLFGAEADVPQEIALERSLKDPVFGGIITNVNHDLLYHIEYAGRRTRDYRISVYDYPALIRADAKIIYPSYTKLPEKVIIDTRQISAVEGSQINLTFILNKPVTEASLEAFDGPGLGLIADDEQPNVYTTSITATQNQRYELHLADAQGLKNKMPPRFVIDVHKNLPPKLSPVFPNRDVQASPLEELSLEAEVCDDFGVTSFGLSYTLAGTQSNVVTLCESPQSQGKQVIAHLLALEDFGAQPDQLLTYYFWADDIGPDGRTRRTKSSMYFAEIRHFEEVFRESQSFQDQRSQSQREGGEQQGQQGEQLARLQKQIISATWNIKQQADRSGGINDSKKDLDVVQQSQADVLQKARSAMTQAEDQSATAALQGATKHMETSLDHLTKAEESALVAELTPALAAEQLAYQELLKARQREHQVARTRGLDRNSNERSASFERQLQQLELRQREDRYETQRLAQSEQQATQREDVAVLNRLGELARRQNEMSDRLRDVQAALQSASGEKEEQRQEISRELKRLREEQLQSLRDVDEIQQRMERPENRQRMADAREKLDQSRSRIRQSAEELEQAGRSPAPDQDRLRRVSRAITSTTRAQRQLEQMRDEFQRSTSGQFSEQMHNMREQAQQLDRRQRQIADEIKQQISSGQKTLADSGARSELADRIDRQRESIKELLDQMKNVSEQAQESEPLLSRKLYDTLRKASTDNVDRALEATAELLGRNFLPQAQQIERQAGRSIEDLRQGVEEAARSVLGDGAESLRLARQQLDELIRNVNDEIARTGSSGVPRDSIRETSNEIGPLTGRDFRQWSDRLRDVEEMLTEQELRQEVARIRDRATAIRAEFKRRGCQPQWDMVQQLITDPLTELRNRISEELARLKSDKAIVPIDRDPVPNRFAELVRSYFENLGGDE